jgi:PAS domain S-box-containing protein
LIPRDGLPSQNQNAFVNSICMKLLEARGAQQVIPGGRMSTPAINSELFEPPRFPTRQVLYGMAVLLVIAVVPFLVWPVLAARILASNFLPHLYCYLGKPGLVWTHVVADSLIGLSYVTISGTLGYLAQKGRGDIPFQWMFLAFGAFIVACGGTHFMEVVTVWVPVYVLSAGLKVVTALVSMTTAVLLPFTVPRVLCLIQTAKASEATEAKFHQIADNIQEIFWMVDAITMQAIYVNPAFEEITGRTRASLQEAPLSYREIIHSADRARVLSRLYEAQLTGKFDEEFRITRPDGTIRWVEAQGFPIRDAQGNIYRLAGVVQDITERKRADEALRRSEAEARARAEELEVILDAVPGMALIARDPACHKITGSRAAYDMLRLPYGANISKAAPDGERPSTFRVITDGQELPASELPIQKAATTGQEVRESEIAVVFDDGTARAMLGNAAPLLDDKGAVRGAVGVFVDITERKRVEEALRESEDRYRDLVEHSQDLLCTHDLEGKLVSTNPAPARILGYEVAELLKIPMRELIAPEYREQFDQYLVRVKTVGVDKGLMAVVTRTGERRIWEYHNTLRTEGVPSPIVRGMAHDVTDRIRAEREMRASEERFRQLAENIREVFYLTDLQSRRTLYISPAYEEVWGRTCQSLYEDEDMESWREAIHPDDRDAALRAYVSHSPFMHEYRIVRPDGGMRWICDRGFPIRNEKGQVYRLAGIAEDITERKRSEHALQESQAALARVTRIATMGELTASIAHEINQPLGAVVTNGGAALHWMAGQPPNLQETREAIERTIREAKRASDVIGRIRALLQKAPPRMERLDLNAVIREVLTLADNELLRGGVRVQTDLARDLPAVLGDRVQFRQVILNLILNGIDAMSTTTDRPRKLRIRSAQHPDGVLIQVQDSGKGVDPDQADRIFQSFFTTKPQGIGMGLSISRSMVEAHGGRLWFTPGSSHGAVFQFTVPETGQAS